MKIKDMRADSEVTKDPKRFMDREDGDGEVTPDPQKRFNYRCNFTKTSWTGEALTMETDSFILSHQSISDFLFPLTAGSRLMLLQRSRRLKQMQSWRGTPTEKHQYFFFLTPMGTSSILHTGVQFPPPVRSGPARWESCSCPDHRP